MENKKLSDYAAETKLIYLSLTTGKAFAWWRDHDGANRVTALDEVPDKNTIVRFTEDTRTKN